MLVMWAAGIKRLRRSKCGSDAMHILQRLLMEVPAAVGRATGTAVFQQMIQQQQQRTTRG
jgi:hypothetical protein